MRALRKIRCLLLILGLSGIWCAARAQDVVIVVNREAQISEISADDLRAIYTGGRSRLPHGVRVSPVTLKGGPAHEVFLRNYLRQSPEEFRTAWRKAVFAGQGAMPRSFDSESALLQFVAATPGALGYVSRISPADGVKSLTVLKVH